MRCAPVLQVVADMAVLCSRCRGFGADDEPITCVVLGGGPCSACKEMVAIRHQIKQLEEELAKLKAKHNTILTTMNAIHDPFIHKLPPEIGSRIFRFCLPLPLDFKEIPLCTGQAQACALGVGSCVSPVAPVSMDNTGSLARHIPCY